MNLSQARDMVRNILVAPGSEQKWRIPMPLIDQVINAQCQVHFESTKSLTGYWTTLAVQGQDEYNMPEGIVAITLLKIAGIRYFPASFPYVDGAIHDSEGTLLTNTDQHWYWVEGDKYRIYPEPEASATAYTTGTIVDPTTQIVGSIITPSTGTLGAVNTLKRYLVLLGSVYYTISANSAATFTVDGTPAHTATTFTIYDPSIQLWGTRRPDDLTSGSDDDIPGSDADAMAIVYATALEMAMTLPDKRKREVNIQGLSALHNQYFRRASKSSDAKSRAPLAITPWTFRTDQAGTR